MQGHPALLALGGRGCPPPQARSRAQHRGRGSPQETPPARGCVPDPLHTPPTPHLPWHCPAPLPACSRRIFQMDVSILLLVIKARGQRRSARLCPGGGPDAALAPPASLPRAVAPPACSGQGTAAAPTPARRGLGVGAATPLHPGGLCPSWSVPRGARPHGCHSLAPPGPDPGCQLLPAPCGGRRRRGPGAGRDDGVGTAGAGGWG